MKGSLVQLSNFDYFFQKILIDDVTNDIIRAIGYHKSNIEVIWNQMSDDFAQLGYFSHFFENKSSMTSPMT